MSSISPCDAYERWLGIPRAEQPPNYYRLLELPPTVSDSAAVELAARRQMERVQREAGGQHSDLVAQLLQQIAAARLCLSDPRRRAAYDAQWGFAASPAPASDNPTPGSAPADAPTPVPAPVAAAPPARPAAAVRRKNLPVARPLSEDAVAATAPPNGHGRPAPVVAAPPPAAAQRAATPAPAAPPAVGLEVRAKALARRRQLRKQWPVVLTSLLGCAGLVVAAVYIFTRVGQDPDFSNTGLSSPPPATRPPVSASQEPTPHEDEPGEPLFPVREVGIIPPMDDGAQASTTGGNPSGTAQGNGAAASQESSTAKEKKDGSAARNQRSGAPADSERSGNASGSTKKRSGSSPASR